MNVKFYVIALLTIGSFSLFACKDDDGSEPCSVAWSTEVSAEADAWVNAAQAYGQNQSTENCNAYKAAGQAYLNALQPYGDCATLTGAQRNSWEAAIAQAQASIDGMEC